MRRQRSRSPAADGGRTGQATSLVADHATPVDIRVETAVSERRVDKNTCARTITRARTHTWMTFDSILDVGKFSETLIIIVS